MIYLPIPKIPVLSSKCTATIEVLDFLNGRELDDISFGWLDSVRPSVIRITHGEIKCDSHLWRVTVYLTKTNLIEKIVQEVGLSSPNLNGREMWEAVISSPVFIEISNAKELGK